MRPGIILQTGSVKGDVDLAVRAEAAGFDSVFTIEFFNRHGYVPLGAIAQATERVRIGTGIANAFTRTPLLHASAAMDLDELSGGRMILGLGSATRRMNEDWYGVPFSAPAKRMEELCQLLRAAFEAQKGGGFRWEGEFWDLKVPIYARPGAARPQIPIWIAAVNRGMIRTVGAAGDGLVGHPVAPGKWSHQINPLSGRWLPRMPQVFTLPTGRRCQTLSWPEFPSAVRVIVLVAAAGRDLAAVAGRRCGKDAGRVWAGGRDPPRMPATIRPIQSLTVRTGRLL